MDEEDKEYLIKTLKDILETSKQQDAVIDALCGAIPCDGFITIKVKELIDAFDVS